MIAKRLLIGAFGGVALAVTALLLWPQATSRSPTVVNEPNKPSELPIVSPATPISSGPASPSARPVIAERVIVLSQQANPSLRALVDPKSPDVRTPTDIATRIPSVTTPEEVQAVLELLRDPRDHDTERNEAIELLRRSHFPELTHELIARLDDVEERPRFRAFVAQQLSAQMELPLPEMELVSITARLVRGLDDAQPGVRREALLALVKVKHGSALNEVRHGLTSAKWHTDRDLVVRCLGALGMRDFVADIRPLAYDGDVSTRIAAINVLGQWRDEVSRSAIEEARASAVPRIRNAGEIALNSLNGVKNLPAETVENSDPSVN